MKLRILRKFIWVLNCPYPEMKMGGTNPYKLISNDTLQFFNKLMGFWEDVEIVEEEKPEHPNNKNLKKKYYEIIDFKNAYIKVNDENIS